MSLDSDGGFLVQSSFAEGIYHFEVGGPAELWPRCTLQPIGANSNGVVLPAVDETSRVEGSQLGGVQVYWDNEADQITATKMKFRNMEMKLHRLTALTYVTEELLQDRVALGAFVQRKFQEAIGWKLDDGVLRGTGSGQLLGILNSDALISVAKETGQGAATIVYENVQKMWARMPYRNRRRAVWYINQDVEHQLNSMVLPVGTGGVPVYLPAGGLNQAGYSTLFRRPVIPIEQCSTLGTVGDIVLADLNEYVKIERETRADVSIHVRFIFGESAFRFIARANGQPAINSAITPANGSNTLSPFVALATRA